MQRLTEPTSGSVHIAPEKTYFLQTTYQTSGNLLHRIKLIRDYMLSLSSENLLRNYLLEAGLWMENRKPEGIHWGWESPTSQLRGHFLGHWLSGAAQLYAQTGDTELKGKADAIVSRLEECQQKNGGEWVFSIPEKYLEWIGRGEIVWAPQYTIHKTLMGLWDMYAYAGNRKAFEMLLAAARWFGRWSASFSPERFADVLDFETGGMLEIWANLYGETKDPEHLALLNRYWRSRVFDPVMEGRDALTNLHANTTIPEILGAARAWEVTGEQRWRDVTLAYWKSAVTDRGYYVTGGQTNGEAWTPPHKLSARLGKHNQEHCSVYNMMRLASTLYRWSGDPAYADYWERNFYNGLLAQEHPHTGMVAYYLPMEAGNCKNWGHPTEDFWCCHGTLVQAPACIPPNLYHFTESAFRVSQYLPSELNCTYKGSRLQLRMKYAATIESEDRPMNQRMKLELLCEPTTNFAIELRVPWWVKGTPLVWLNGEPVEVTRQGALIVLERAWQDDEIVIQFDKQVVSIPMPDAPEMTAFMDGPIVLAGLCQEETAIETRNGKPESLLVPHNEFSCECWRGEYKTRGQHHNLRFVPLHTITDEQYAIYFPVIE